MQIILYQQQPDPGSSKVCNMHHVYKSVFWEALHMMLVFGPKRCFRKSCEMSKYLCVCVVMIYLQLAFKVSIGSWTAVQSYTSLWSQADHELEISKSLEVFGHFVIVDLCRA